MAKKKTYVIPEELLQKYNMPSIEFYDTPNDFYYTFLCVTDYICNKIVEGVSTWDQYADAKTARAFASEQITNEAAASEEAEAEEQEG